MTPEEWLSILHDVTERAGLNPHPLIGHQWEQERCPDCGTVGVVKGDRGVFQRMACPRCDPELT